VHAIVLRQCGVRPQTLRECMAPNTGKKPTMPVPTAYTSNGRRARVSAHGRRCRIPSLPFPPLPHPNPHFHTSTTASDFCHVSHSNIFSPSASMTGRLPRHGSCGITLAMCRRPAPQFRRAKTIRRANKIHDALPPRFCRCRCRFRPLPTGKGPAHVLNTASGTTLAAPTAAGAFHIADALSSGNNPLVRRSGECWPRANGARPSLSLFHVPTL
jgi:hypothetical protein